MSKRHWSYQGEKNRAIVLRRGYCEIGMDGCTGRAETVDHIIPRSLGGPDIIENLRAACWHCNMSKGKRLVAQGGERSGGRPFFSDGGYRRAPLLSTPPRTRWTPLTAGDYRQASTSGRSRP
jgi:5-methylcytosine-specific restriction endonuclease McrA